MALLFQVNAMLGAVSGLLPLRPELKPIFRSILNRIILAAVKAVVCFQPRPQRLTCR